MGIWQCLETCLPVATVKAGATGFSRSVSDYSSHVLERQSVLLLLGVSLAEGNASYTLSLKALWLQILPTETNCHGHTEASLLLEHFADFDDSLEPRAPARYEARHPGRLAAAGKSRGLTGDAAASAARPSAGHGGARRGRWGSGLAAARTRTPAPTSASREGRGSAPPQSCPPRFAAAQRLRAPPRGGGRCRAVTAEGVAGRAALGARPGPAGRAEDGCPERRGQSRARALPPRAPSRAGPVRDPAAGAVRAPVHHGDAARPDPQLDPSPKLRIPGK
uniref:Serine/arginine repetitive matrix protein 3 n=1 Tax=Callorhinus ursinus TaxID=34884 RepID=A0A3Q7NTR3_CALUR|nr:serine/arginine repetitive matrix protein 3 [Callorhinus ursinus]